MGLAAMHANRGHLFGPEHLDQIAEQVMVQAEAAPAGGQLTGLDYAQVLLNEAGLDVLNQYRAGHPAVGLPAEPPGDERNWLVRRGASEELLDSPNAARDLKCVMWLAERGASFELLGHLCDMDCDFNALKCALQKPLEGETSEQIDARTLQLFSGISCAKNALKNEQGHDETVFEINLRNLANVPNGSGAVRILTKLSPIVWHELFGNTEQRVKLDLPHFWGEECAIEGQDWHQLHNSWTTSVINNITAACAAPLKRLHSISTSVGYRPGEEGLVKKRVQRIDYSLLHTPCPPIAPRIKEAWNGLNGLEFFAHEVVMEAPEGVVFNPVRDGSPAPGNAVIPISCRRPISGITTQYEYSNEARRYESTEVAAARRWAAGLLSPVSLATLTALECDFGALKRALEKCLSTEQIEMFFLCLSCEVTKEGNKAGELVEEFAQINLRKLGGDSGPSRLPMALTADVWHALLGRGPMRVGLTLPHFWTQEENSKTRTDCNVPGVTAVIKSIHQSAPDVFARKLKFINISAGMSPALIFVEGSTTEKELAHLIILPDLPMLNPPNKLVLQVRIKELGADRVEMEAPDGFVFAPLSDTSREGLSGPVQFKAITDGRMRSKETSGRGTIRRYKFDRETNRYDELEPMSMSKDAGRPQPAPVGATAWYDLDAQPLPRRGAAEPEAGRPAPAPDLNEAQEYLLSGVGGSLADQLHQDEVTRKALRDVGNVFDDIFYGTLQSGPEKMHSYRVEIAGRLILALRPLPSGSSDMVVKAALGQRLEKRSVLAERFGCVYINKTAGEKGSLPGRPQIELVLKHLDPDRMKKVAGLPTP
jgi:hypothetical protein